MDGAGDAAFPGCAPQDAGAARRIRDALRAAEAEVWFDPSELRDAEARRTRRPVDDP